MTRIVQERLRELGRPSGASEVYEQVRLVARENQIRNPDRLSLGQRLELGVLGRASSVSNQQPAAPLLPLTTASRQALIPSTPTSSVSSPESSKPEGLPLRRNFGKVFRHVSRDPMRSAEDSLRLGRDERPHILVPSNASKDGKDGMGGPAPGSSGMQMRSYREAGNLVTAVRRVFRADEAQDIQSAETKVTLIGEAPWSRTIREPARMSSGYGMRRDPFTGRPAFHKGVDLAAKTGTEIFPVDTGVVKFSGWQSGYGRIVVVEHADGIESVYAHNSNNLVAPGQIVSPDEPIAKVGSSGRSTGPHLHFEVRRDGRAIDPMPYLRGGIGASVQLADAR